MILARAPVLRVGSRHGWEDERAAACGWVESRRLGAELRFLNLLPHPTVSRAGLGLFSKDTALEAPKPKQRLLVSS